MNYIFDLLSYFLRGRNSVWGIILFVGITFLYYAFPRPYSTLECVDGYCKLFKGSKELNAFAVQDVQSCEVSSMTRRCTRRTGNKSRKYHCYYPVITLNDGQRVYLPSSFESRYKDQIRNFCGNLKSGKDFTHKER